MLKKHLAQTTKNTDTEQSGKRGAMIDTNDDESMDMAVIASFRDLQQPGAPDFVTELIDLFLEDTGKRITALKQAAAGSDVKIIKIQAHGIKGSSGNIGARKLMTLSSRLEEDTIDAVSAWLIISEMEDEFETVAGILKAMRKDD